jgi:uncharacterized protein (TIGR02246 family)
MKHRLCSGIALGLLVLMAGCAPAPPPAPPDTRAADEKAIRDGDVAWRADWAAKDVEKIVSHYADDAALMIPGIPTMKGTAAIRDGLKAFVADPNLALTFTAATAEVSKAGDLAYTQGTYTLITTDPKTKKPVTEKGKYVTVYRKVGDTWKAVQDINNADPTGK